MKFKIDENLPVELAEFLRNEGYDAITVIEQNLSGRSDSTVASVCKKEMRIIITLDTDFADIREYPPAQYPGIIVLCIRKQDKQFILQLFKRVIRLFQKEKVDKHLWILEEDRIRIRS